MAHIDLSDKVAVITGGCKGMGFGIAQAFQFSGARLCILSNDVDSLKDAAAMLDRGDVIVHRADVAKSDDVEGAIARTVQVFGKIDVLVNSAGVQRYGTVVETSTQTWDEVMNVNLKGVFHASKHAIPQIARQGGGAVINLCSVQAFASQQNVAAYTASKGAILSLTRAMALDHASENIRVNAICPAAIDTPMLRGAADLWKGHKTAAETIEAWGKGHPVGRVGTVAEVAALVAFLASDLCPFMTGADLKVDGGVLSKLGIILPESDT